MTFLVSVISPMYNVGRYLADYFASLEEQTYGFDDLEVILVDDGSTDDTAELAQEFARRHPANVRYVHQSNGGQASARSAGIAHATGEWVTFPDPDDVLSPNYFRDVADLMATPDAEGAAMFTARMLLWFEAQPSAQAVRDTHALARRFEAGTRVIDLEAEPEVVQAHVTTGFLRRDVILAEGLRFRESLRLRFEDGNFVTRYLLTFTRPRIGMVATSDYLYRQRADASSTIQSSSADARKYTDTIRHGYLDVVEVAGGSLPRWAQNLIIYDIMWIFRSSQGGALRRVRFGADVYRELDELLPAIARHLDPDAIRQFSVMPVQHWMKDALILQRSERGHGPVHFGAIDPKRGLFSLVYRFRGAPPEATAVIAGEPARPRYTADWELEYVGRPVVTQRTVWLALDGATEFSLDGQRQPITLRVGDPTVDVLTAELLRTRADASDKRAEPPAKISSVQRRIRRRAGITLREAKAIVKERPSVRAAAGRLSRAWGALSPLLTRKFEGAWVFIDRDVDANDSAEVLYKWVAREHPEINSWFVLRKGSPDWARLAAEGVRLVAYGSHEFAALLLSAEHVASSHADRFISDPLPKRFGRRSWNFTFLQHGVIKGDISGWLNSKAIATFVTSTQAEYDYIAGPSPFRFGPKEVRLTGLPRFDALLAQDAAVPDERRDTVLFMPTWRDYLVGALSGSSSRERATLDGFHDTAYARSVAALFSSPRLRAVAERDGLRLAFMPHPNMHRYLDRFELPDFVDVVSYDEVDVREMIARARVLVTDYSSTAFNMAYVQRPVVYFQFDREEYFAGHTERAAYFTYETHGFGPVVTDADAAVEAIDAALTARQDPVYAERMRETFPVRDGRNSERVFRAMEEARSMRPAAERRIPAAPDTWAAVQGDAVKGD